MHPLPGVVVALITTGCALTGAESPHSVSEAFRAVCDSVVVVRTKERQVAAMAQPGRPARFVRTGGFGSGVLVRMDDRVVVLTAAHVVQAADAIQIGFLNGKTAAAKVQASSPTADIALLELDGPPPPELRPAELGDSDEARVGDRIFVVGAPHGLEYTLTVGYIGARRSSSRTLGTMARMELFQTDASINPGNSGGPMFDEKGRVVGIVSHILTLSGGFEGTGFAVTSNLARGILCDDAHFWTGIESQLVSGELARVFQLPQEAGLMVQRVAHGSPGEKLGILPGTIEATIGGQKLLVGGDIILSAAGVPVSSGPAGDQKVRERLRALGPDDELSVKVLRSGQIVELRRRRSEL